MIREIYTAAMGMLPQQTRLEVTANNIANANTPGYKKESVFEKSLIDASANMNDTPGVAEQNDPPVGCYTDFAQGVFQQTDNPLDIAIDNKNGFFAVYDDAGKQYLTRAGHFKLSESGQIVDAYGRKLQSTNLSSNLFKDITQNDSTLAQSISTDIKISDNGEIFINRSLVGNLEVVVVENPETLVREAKSSFTPGSDTNMEILSSEDVKVKQGWLENSNIDIVKEMVNMIELQRAFEMGSKVIHTNTETIDQSIKIGRFV